MGMFICNRCNNLRDSDDGCDEDLLGENKLVCQDCLEDGANDCDYCFDEIESDMDFVANEDGIFHTGCLEGRG